MKRAVHTDKAPAAIGPYSQAIAAGSMLFVSGQIPLDPATGALVGSNNIQAATHQVMKNLGAVLACEGLTWDDLVRTTIFLRTMDDFQAVNEVYASYFTSTPPARACVAAAGLPKDVRVEIDGIALLKEG